MKNLIFIIIIILITLSSNITFSQDINKLTYKPLEKEFIELTKKMALVQSKDTESIKMALEGLKKHKEAPNRYNLIFWKLSYHYASLKQYDKCLEILKKGQDKGLFYYLGTKERVFPPYRKEIEKLEGYEKFRTKNEKLKASANKTGNTEYMIQLPEHYDQNTNYPLLLIMHGGIGNIPDLQYNYQSEKLSKEFIVVYTQGSRFFGSFSRAYNHENWRNNIKNIYQQISSNYSVDTSRVILAGPSAGGYRSIELGLNNEIPAKGLLLSFAVNPRVWDSTLYIKSAKRGLKVTLLCGENDWAIQVQKKLGYWFDQYGIENRFVVFPEEGHNFPKDWEYYLNTSIEYLLEEK